MGKLAVDNTIFLGEIDEIEISYSPDLQETQFAICHKPRCQTHSNYFWVPKDSLHLDIPKEHISKEIRKIKYDTIQSIIGGSKDLEYYKMILKKFEE